MSTLTPAAFRAAHGDSAGWTAAEHDRYQQLLLIAHLPAGESAEDSASG